MFSRIALLGLLLLFCGPLPAALQAVEDGVELRLNTVQLPRDSSAALRFRRCPTCSPEALRVTAATSWLLAAGRTPTAVSLTEFAGLARDSRADSFIYIYFRPGSDIVTRVILDPLARPPEPAGGSRR